MKIFTDSDVDFIKQNYAKMGAEKCALILNKLQKQIRIKAQKLGIKTDFATRSEIIKNWKSKKTKPNSSYSVNPEQFFEITTPQTAYLLGFLWADGYVYVNKSNKWTIGLGIVKEDFDKHIKHILEYHGRWNIKYHNQKNRREQGRARISNKPLGKFLESIGYRSKSNSASKVIEIIPDKLKPYWFRGLLDGDGCVYVAKNNRDCNVNISSCIDQDWTYMNDLCKKLNIHGIVSKRENKTGKNSRFTITRKKDMIVFFNYIYENYDCENIGFSRKHDKYLIIKNNYHPTSSKHKGLSKTPSNTWQVRMCQKGFNIFVGTFKTEYDAIKAYNNAAIDKLGKDAILNHIDC